MRIYFFMLSLFLLCSCSDSGNSSVRNKIDADFDYYKAFNNKELLDSLSYKVMKDGDTASFLQLKRIYFRSENHLNFLYFSIYMADNYNYLEAYRTNYNILKTDSLHKNNKRTNMLANYYLLKAYEHGDSLLKNTVKERFKNESIPKSEDFWKKINE